MKATGIVRRIDDLGRVVIPKEIRRTMRIREGDPLEIYTDANGEVIFKKYSPMGELEPYTKQYAEVLYRTSNLPVLIFDRDRVIAAAGLPKRDALDKRITPMLEEYMERRASYVKENGSGELLCAQGIERPTAVMAPIIGGGDVMGAVVFLTDDEGKDPTPTDVKLIQVAASFLGKQMEE
ncbi:MAG: AbrB/MazE/SpoVT family DNA-binding domain-containing protein [Clostridia bacterium]|nr:AbrB/MazE/SpoVT family DNA-binding domain-containing protein [Clostridia bacterium]